MPRRFRIANVVAGFCLLGIVPTSVCLGHESPLQFESKILLGDVRGRIDHMAVDAKRRRLYVAELGNDSVGVVDLARGSVVRTISGLNEPQGVGYEPSTDTLYVANARDGTVKLFDGEAYAAKGQIALGIDADNVRIDAATGRVMVGYGDGALAAIDPATRTRIGNIALKSHPESFQIDGSGDRIFVNLPEAHAIAVLDGKSGKQLASWRMDMAGNFAMALDRARGQVLVAFRNPPRLAVFSMADGKPVLNVDTCGDVDDLFVDSKRKRVYVSCGAGSIDVFEMDDGIYRNLARVPTAAGARTSLFVPELDRLFVAVRAGAAGPSAIWVFMPQP